MQEGSRRSALAKEVRLKEKIIKLLETTGFEELPQALQTLPSTKIISFLIGAFLHPVEEVRWKAVYGFGLTTARIAELEPERARIIIRRLMWMLNEESGSIPWGVGEGFAEALYHSQALKREYLHLFLSYVWPEGNYLEFPPAQRGFFWGIGRLAQKYLDDLYTLSAHEYLIIHLTSPDPIVVFYVLWALSFFGKKVSPPEGAVKNALAFLEKNLSAHLFFDGQKLSKITPQHLRESLKASGLLNNS